MRLLPCGERSVLAEVDSQEEVWALQARILRLVAAGDSPWAGVEDVVPAARTVLVVSRSRSAVSSLRAALGGLATGRDDTAPDRPSEQGATGDVVIRVSYDGADLARVASLTGLTPAEVVAAHTRTPWWVAFGGFLPGFAYLVGGDPRLVVPRRSEPRASVPAGSVGLAGEYSGVYPQSSPGGWQLIGRTDAVLFDDRRDPPARLRPGMRVTFEDASSTAPRPHDATRAGAASAEQQTADQGSETSSEVIDGTLQVVRTGPMATLQDLGRPGYGASGVAVSGAADRSAARVANALVGNPAGAAVIEVLLGGLVLRAVRGVAVAVTGAVTAVSVDGQEVAWGKRIVLAGGETIRLGMASTGLRAYVAAAGGMKVEPVLGSCSRDSLSGLGPAPLRAGDTLYVDGESVARARPRIRPDSMPSTDVPAGRVVAPSAAGDQHGAESRPDQGRRSSLSRRVPVTLDALPGPRLDWLRDPGVLAGPWRMSTLSDRVGVRLEGDGLARAEGFEGRELPPEPVMRGCVQVPPGGQPVVFGPDHPATGGYPVVAVLTEAASDLLAQVRPHETVTIKLLR